MWRKLYNAMLESGELIELMPDATGVWEEDKKTYTTICEQNEEDMEEGDEISITLLDEYDEDDW